MSTFCRPLSRYVTAIILSCVIGFSASAHQLRDPLERVVTQAAPAAPVEVLTGVVHKVIIEDRTAGVVLQFYSLTADDGRKVRLQAVGDSVLDGARIEAHGRRNGKSFFVDSLRQVAGPARESQHKSNAVAELRGKLALLHVDYFDEDRSEVIAEVHDDQGGATPLRMDLTPEALQTGMQVTVSAQRVLADASVVPSRIVIDALPPAPLDKEAQKAVTTNSVLVILMTFADSGPVPFTQAQVQSVMGGGPGSGSVAEYFKEASYGQQLLTSTVTPWLATAAATPANCNWSQMGTIGRTAATNAGYNVNAYQNVVYVFPSVGACGWIGLGYVGASGVWINGRNATSVYGHELGHNFGLLHAGSLRCTGAVIGGSCAVSEYGDPFGVMGNQSAMHFSAMQKLDLGWIGSGTVATHTAGTTTYTLAPLETAGGALYAVKIPAFTNRTYWLEYRQPIGFDSGLASYPNNGVQVRVGAPLETLCDGCDAWSNDTELLDMVPGTATFTDATLVAGRSFMDTAYGISINVVSATSGAVTVRVTSPGGVATSSVALASSNNPSNAGSSVSFTASVTGAAPTGSVAFKADGATIAGCSAVALTGVGNTRLAACSTANLSAGTHAISASYAGDAANSASSGGLNQVVAMGAAATAWVDDGVPAGATLQGDGDSWTWVTTPAPVSGNLAHQSALASGLHQHYFFGATTALDVQVGDTLFTYVYVDPANPPSEIMLQWFDGIWEHRAFWGANIIGLGVTGTTSRYYAGPLPTSGEWVRLEVPASALGLEGHRVTGIAFTLFGGRVTWDATGRAPGTSPSGWVDDSIPVGAVSAADFESWKWVSNSPTPTSGGLAHQSALASGLHQHYFYGASTGIAVQPGDAMFVYVYLDPVNPPSEVMVQWYDGMWEHRAYWGADLIGLGVNGAASRYRAGPLPATGQWVKLTVPASAIGLEGRTVTGMAFTLFDGRATWDVAGRAPGKPSQAWIDDSVPAGANVESDLESWSWIGSNPTPFSGALAHQSALVNGLHQHYFYGASDTLDIQTGDTLFAMVYLDPVNPPSEVMLQWYDGAWEHRAYWGANLVGLGVDATASRYYAGSLPPAGKWVRLAVPASAVGLEGRSVSGLAFTLFNGRATWDVAGK